MGLAYLRHSKQWGINWGPHVKACDQVPRSSISCVRTSEQVLYISWQEIEGGKRK